MTSPLNRLLDDYLDPQQLSLLPVELRHRLEGLGRLMEVVRNLAAEIDPSKILDTITQEACQAMRCDRASLYRYDPDTKELFTSVVTQLEISEIRRGLDEGIAGFVAQNLELVNVPAPAQDPRWSPSIDRVTGYQTRNILAAPLLNPRDGSLVGVLQLLNRDDGPFDKYDEQLLVAFSQHAAAAVERVRLVEQLKRQHSIDTSLEVAREIQRGFMPSQLPRVAGYEVATWWRPNEAVGGDYCDVIPLKDRRAALAIADVSGHGLGPSLIMAAVRAALHALVLEHTAPEVLLNLLARSLRMDLTDGRFITMVIAVLDPVDHSLEYANAGHAPALHYDAATREFSDLESTGMPLGVVDRADYHQGWPITLEVGDIVVLCTDGIVEAMDRNNREFGRERLDDLLYRSASLPVSDIVQRVGKAVEEHYEGDSPPDDLTILAVRRNK